MRTLWYTDLKQNGKTDEIETTYSTFSPEIVPTLYMTLFVF